MLMFLFKLCLTFLLLTILSVLAMKVISDLIEEEVIDSKHENVLYKWNFTALGVFGGLTLLNGLIWVFCVVWAL